MRHTFLSKTAVDKFQSMAYFALFALLNLSFLQMSSTSDAKTTAFPFFASTIKTFT